ncbi:MAG: hypothetical protein RIF32_17160 [Leptospirales bacterium]|jgi:hypothetical protein
MGRSRQILSILFLLGSGVALGAQESKAGGVPRVEGVLQGGERFEDPRLALSFIVPFTSVVRVRGRGNFHGVDIESVDSGALYVYHTSYRIRRPEGLESKLLDALRVGFGPCELPEAPAGETFEIDARCTGSIGLNEIVRNTRMIRDREILHLLHISSRVETEDAAREMLRGVRVNEQFARHLESSGGDNSRSGPSQPPEL